MKLYWSAKSFPELQGLSKEEMRNAWRRAFRRAMRDPRVIFSCVIIVLAFTVANGLLDRLMDRAGLSGILRDVWVIGYGAAIGLVTSHAFMAGVARALRAERQAHADDPADGS